MSRGREYVNSINTNELWSLLGLSHLNKDEIQEAINCFLKCKDGSEYIRVIYLGEQFKIHELLINYLKMCRETAKDTAIDNSLAFSYASLNKL